MGTTHIMSCLMSHYGIVCAVSCRRIVAAAFFCIICIGEQFQKWDILGFLTQIMLVLPLVYNIIILAKMRYIGNLDITC